MIRRRMLIGGLFVCGLYGCQINERSIKTHATDSKAAAEFRDQTAIKRLILEAGIAHPDRSLVHISHTCTLQLNDENYSVVDMRELVKGAMSARGINSIVLLDPANQLVQKLEYGQARPLFCEGNTLYLYGDITIDGHVEEGNALEFTDGGLLVDVLNVDINQKLPL